jgi:hypothetical protein
MSTVKKCDSCGMISKQSDPKGWTHLSASKSKEDDYRFADADLCPECTQDGVALDEVPKLKRELGRKRIMPATESPRRYRKQGKNKIL